MATLTDSLLNGLKSLFSGLGAKTTDSNYAVPLVNKSSAEPAGYMEMANLASVLGAANILLRVLDGRVAEATSGSLNSLKKGMIYVADPGVLDDEPSGMVAGPTAYFYLGKTGMDRGVQVGFHISNTTGNAKIYMRGETYNGWTAWKSITLT